MKSFSRRKKNKSKSKRGKKLAKDFLQASVGNKVFVSKTGNILIK